MAQEADGLDGLTESHLIREDAVETVLVERYEPLHALELVLPQLRGHQRQELLRLALDFLLGSLLGSRLLGLLLLGLSFAGHGAVLHLLGEELTVDGGLVEERVEVGVL